MPRAPLTVPRKDCESGCKIILGRAIRYAEAAETLFSAQRKQEAYALSFLGMDELGKFFLIAKAMRTTREDPVAIVGFFDHNPKMSEVIDYYKRIGGSDGLKLLSALSKLPTLALSDISLLAYAAFEGGEIATEAEVIDANPLGFRNAAYYVDYDRGWKSPRYPGDKICAGQVKLVKGAAKGYLQLIVEKGLAWLLNQDHLFLP
jgi:AbiV family abortive infection protein